jgi:two-component system C4-dicarboxylate transport sensor histidine kinase DctB
MARLERLGWLATGLTHDLNNTLASVLGEIGEVGERLGEMRVFLGNVLGRDAAIPAVHIDACEASLETMKHALQTAVSHGRELQRLYRGETIATARQRVDLRDAAGRAITFARRRLRASLVIEGGKVAAAVDRETIVRVLLNLLINASDALRTREEPRIRLRIAATAPWATCDVIDNGSGVPPEILPRLFEPFVTSKPAGTGLGLAISRQIVREAGGDLVLVETGPGGTTFRVMLPIAEGEGAEPPRP